MCYFFFFFQAEDGIRDVAVTGVQTCALPILYRWYRAEHYARRVELIREHLPHAAIGADAIAGFPGETEEDHAATLAFMEGRERKRFDESKRRGVILFCLAGEACDCVGADGGMGEVLANEFNTARVVLGTIPAVHGSEDAIRARLQRHVEVLGKPFGRSKELNQVLRDVHGLDGTEAQMLNGRLLQNATKQVSELHLR